ncbi:hypothetical protein ACR9VJ_26160 [Streptomyces sp. H49]|uniref:hypothetical protein n=1 Tax=Streptomyces sp. H49 TaxID=3444117 RepID=UPI003F4A8628
MSDYPETAVRQHIAELIYPTYGQRDTERTLAIVDAVMPAVRAAVAASAERIETVRALCDAADHAGISSGGWFTVEAVRKAISGEAVTR